MKRIRITHPVLGVFVTAMIGMGCLGASPATRSATRRDTIRPGEGVGPIVLGMSEAELEDTMGKPATVPWNDSLTVRQYPAKSVSVLLSKQEPRTVAAILAGRPDGVVSTMLMGPLPWRTEEGLGMGSTADDITAAYGAPDNDQRLDGKEDWHLMIYTHRGIQLGLRDGQVAWIAVKKPAQVK
jgi:hypothetical protein